LPRDGSDEELVRRMLAREPRAWRRFEERYRNLMYGSIIRVLNRVTAGVTSADVDEVYADLITSLLRDDMRRLRVWNPSRGAGLGTWLVHVVKNMARNHVRSVAKLRLVRDDEELHELPSPERSPLEAVLASEVRACLSLELESGSERDRDFFVLYFERRMSVEDIAARMSINVKTVYTKKQKLLARLTASLSAA